MLSSLWSKAISLTASSSSSPASAEEWDPNNLVDRAPGLCDMLTDEQRSILRDVKNRAANGSFRHGIEQCSDDLFLLRFLRARKFNLSLASEMLQTHLDWRHAFNLTSLVEEEKFDFVPELFHYYPRGYYGIDKKGRPLYVESVGSIEVSKIMQLTDEATLIRQYIQEYEYLIRVILPACSIKAGRTIERSLSILDLSGLQLFNFTGETRKLLRMLISLSQDNYPEILGEMFLINTPTIFQVIWGFCKPFLDDETTSKINIIANPNEWKKELRKRVDEDQLPIKLGGTRETNGDVSDLHYGPWADIEILKKVHAQYPTNPPSIYRLGFINVPEEVKQSYVERIVGKSSSYETLESTDVESENNQQSCDGPR